MKIFMVECNAEELRANRTLLDNLNEAISNFTRPMFGVDVDLANFNDETEEEECDE